MRTFLLTTLCIVILAASCKKKEDPPQPVPYATFKLQGVQRTFNFYTQFTKDFCSSSTYCGKFLNKKEADSAAQLKFGIPGDPVVDHVYTTGEYRFSCYYLNENGVRYDLATAPFNVVFSVWEGQGGWAKGTFSGWLRSASNDSILFENGYFQNTIWTMGTR